MNHGKESSKFNRDCTICHPCGQPASNSVVPNKRENRLKWRVRLAGIPTRIRSIALAVCHRMPLPFPTSISSRQWSLAPHTSMLFSALTFRTSWKPREANT